VKDVVTSLEAVRRFFRQIGPVLLIAVLPGGTLLALLWYLHRNRPWRFAKGRGSRTRLRTGGGAGTTLARALASAGRALFGYRVVPS
jgi:hypothetical protein